MSQPDWRVAARRPSHLVRIVDLAVGRAVTANRDAVIDPDGNPVDGVQILEDTDTVDESGNWLPPEEYDRPEQPEPERPPRRPQTPPATSPEGSVTQ